MTQIEEMNFSATDTEAEAIAKLAQAAARPHELVAGKFYAGIYPSGSGVHTLDLERCEDSPWRKRGNAIFSETASFLHYDDLQEEGANFYAHPPEFTVTAVFNDHDGDVAGWRDFTAQLTLKPTLEWRAWKGIDRHYMTATELAEFVEDWRHTIAAPDTADILELIRSFRATKKVSFRDEIIERSGDRALEYVTETEAHGKGSLPVPDSFTLVLAPFDGADDAPLVARFRYRLDNGTAGFGVALEQPDKLARDAFQVELAKITEATGEPVMVGSPASR